MSNNKPRKTSSLLPGKPKVAILMGSDSDWKIMEEGVNILKEFGVEFEVKVISAHRTPQIAFQYGSSCEKKGIKVIIAGAGASAHLPGLMAALTPLPVIGVPIGGGSLAGVDALYSIVQMPKGIPVATVGINNAQNAALLAVQILSLKDKNLFNKFKKYKENLAQKVKEKMDKFNP